MTIKSLFFLLYCLAMYNKQYLLSIKYLKENSFCSHNNSDTKWVGFSPHIKPFDTNYLELKRTPQVKGAASTSDASPKSQVVLLTNCLQVGGSHDPLLRFCNLLGQLTELREMLTYVY